MGVTLLYSAWLILACIAAGLLYSAVLYYKEKKSEIPLKIKWILAVVRFIVVTLLAFFLLSVSVKQITRQLEKPIIIFAQDNSQSIVINKDSLFYKSDYPKLISKFINDISGDYDLKVYTFGDKLSEKDTFSFIDKQTDISAFLDEVDIRYSNRNVGAVIMASDGIYNKGASPVYSSEKIRFPVYTIALGDTNVQKDIILTKGNYNKICYLGNDFPVEIIINANKCAGKKVTLTVGKGDQTLFTKTVDIQNDKYSETVNFQLEAKQTGVQHYFVRLSSVEGEISYKNNNQDVFIEVLDGRQKILILSAAPHPDISALKQSIENNRNYEVDYSLKSEFKKPLNPYNLVILHQLPSKNEPATELIEQIKALKIPILYILGNQSDINMFNRLKTGLNIVQGGSKFDDALPSVNTDFALFTLNDDIKKVINSFPPLSVAYGDYKLANSMNVLCYQKIGNVFTQKPLAIFNNTLDEKNAIICGEGIWRWKLNNYLQNNNLLVFNELISKFVQFLSAKVDKDFFRVKHKNSFYENETVEFDAEVYNESYELVNDQEVKLTITNSEKKSYPYIFSKSSKAYHLNSGSFPVGEYSFVAQVKLGNKTMQKNGIFTVYPLNVEAVNLVADHQMLNLISKKHNAKMFYPQQLDKLIESLKARDDIKTISHSEKRYNDLVNLWWIMLLLIALLSFEWFMRKYFGTY
jgi:hypothetical protein